jgi:signal transduction histidine kinase
LKIIHSHIILLLFAGSLLQAQSFKTWHKALNESLMPSRFIFNTAQDKNNVIWLATDKGLVKMDGNTVKVFNSENGFPGNYVTNMFMVNKEDLWLAFVGSYYYFSPTTEQLFPLKNYLPISVLKVDFAFKINDEVIFRLEYNDKIEFATFKLKDKKLIIDKEFNSSWIVGDHHMTLSNPEWGYWKLLFNRKKERNVSNIGGHINYLDDIKFDAKDKIWNFDNFIFSNKFLIKLDSHHVKVIASNLPFSNNITEMSVYSDDKYDYISKMGEGFVRIDKQGNKTIFNSSFGGYSDQINHLSGDNLGNVMISTLGQGVFSLSNKTPSMFSILDGPIRMITQYGDQVYALSKRSIYVFGSDKKVSIIPLKMDECLSIYVDDKYIYIADFTGVYQGRKGKSIQFKKVVRITAGISSIFKSNDSLYFSCYGSGILNVKNQTLPAAFYKDGKDLVIENTVPWNKYFVSLTSENGCYVFDKSFNRIASYTKKNGLFSNDIKCVYGSGNDLLIGSKVGLNVVMGNKNILSFSSKEIFQNRPILYISKSAVFGVLVFTDKDVYKYVDKKIEFFQSLQLDNDDLPISYLLKNDEFIIGTNKNIIIKSLANENIENSNENVALFKVVSDGEMLALNHLKLKPSFKVLNFLFSFKKNPLFDKTELFWNLNNQEWKKSNDPSLISFSNLRPGFYELKVKENLAFKNYSVIQFCVLTPWWESWWFRSILAISIIPIIFYFSKLQTTKREKALTKEIELANKIEFERQRISRDLHDNIGAYTSALISNIKQLKNELPKFESRVEIIEENANFVLSNLRDTIWILNSDSHTLIELSSNFKNYCFKILKNFEEIEFHSNEDISKDYLLNGVEAININRLLQEALNNSIKHGKPKNIYFEIKSDRNEVVISISDDGVGFNIDRVEKGNGLNNIIHRTNEIGGVATIKSELGKGTSIIFKLNTHNRL